MVVDFLVEFACEAADNGFVAGVGPAEAGGGEAAEVGVGSDDDDGESESFGLDGGGDAGGGWAVDNEVVGGVVGLGDCVGAAGVDQREEKNGQDQTVRNCFNHGVGMLNDFDYFYRVMGCKLAVVCVEY